MVKEDNVGSVIVSWDFSHGRDDDILLIGKKPTGQPVQVINAFSGKEARELRDKLIKRGDKKDG